MNINNHNDAQMSPLVAPQALNSFPDQIRIFFRFLMRRQLWISSLCANFSALINEQNLNVAFQERSFRFPSVAIKSISQDHVSHSLQQCGYSECTLNPKELPLKKTCAVLCSLEIPAHVSFLPAHLRHIPGFSSLPRCLIMNMHAPPPPS